ERTADAAKLAAANEALLAVADTRGEKVERLEKLRGLYGGPAADPAGAYRVSLALFEIDPADAKNRDGLLGFADAAGKTGELAQIADLDESALGDQDHALAAYEKMLELDASDLRAHRALDRHYAARERWRDLETLLGTRVGFASDAEVPELEFRRAELRASHL